MSGNEAVAAAAQLWLSTPYRHQASKLGAGADCLGLVRGVWRQIYGTEPYAVPAYPADPRRDADAGQLLRAAQTWLIEKSGPPELGDVILFRLVRALPPRHCGVISGSQKFIHAQERLGVVEAALSTGWQSRIAGVFSFPSTEA